MITEYLSSYWFWVGLSVFLMIVEVLLGTSFFLLWLGCASLIVGAIAWAVPSVGWQGDVLVFASISMISIIGWRRYLKTHVVQSDRPTLNRRAEQYIGRTFSLSDPIVNGRGKILVEDSTWRVEGADLPAGTQVTVVGVQGVVLAVKARI